MRSSVRLVGRPSAEGCYLERARTTGPLSGCTPGKDGTWGAQLHQRWKGSRVRPLYKDAARGSTSGWQSESSCVPQDSDPEARCWRCAPSATWEAASLGCSRWLAGDAGSAGLGPREHGPEARCGSRAPRYDRVTLSFSTTPWLAAGESVGSSPPLLSRTDLMRWTESARAHDGLPPSRVSPRVVREVCCGAHSLLHLDGANPSGLSSCRAIRSRG